MESLMDEQLDNDELVTRVTGIHDDERSKLFKYAAKLPDSSRRKAMSSAINFLYQHRGKYPKASKVVLIHCGFLLALKSYHYAQHMAMKRKNTSEHVEVIDDLKRAKFASINKNKKAAVLKNRINVYLAEILLARKEGLSFEKITIYLQQEYKIKTSKEYIRRIINGKN